MTPRAEESVGLVLIKGGPVGAEMYRQTYFSTAKWSLKRAPGLSGRLNLASQCRSEEADWWDRLQSWAVLFHPP